MVEDLRIQESLIELVIEFPVIPMLGVDRHRPQVIGRLPDPLSQVPIIAGIQLLLHRTPRDLVSIRIETQGAIPVLVEAIARRDLEVAAFRLPSHQEVVEAVESEVAEAVAPPHRGRLVAGRVEAHALEAETNYFKIKQKL